MEYLLKNLTNLYRLSGWSYENLAAKLKEGVPEKQQFSKDQIRSYEQRLTTPKSHFKNVLADFLRVDVKDIISRELTDKEIEESVQKKRSYLDRNDELAIISEPLVEYLTKELEKKEEKINQLYKRIGFLEKENELSEEQQKRQNNRQALKRAK